MLHSYYLITQMDTFEFGRFQTRSSYHIFKPVVPIDHACVVMYNVWLLTNATYHFVFHYSTVICDPLKRRRSLDHIIFS